MIKAIGFAILSKKLELKFKEASLLFLLQNMKKDEAAAARPSRHKPPHARVSFTSVPGSVLLLDIVNQYLTKFVSVPSEEMLKF